MIFDMKKSIFLILALGASSVAKGVTEIEYTFGSYLYDSSNISQTANGESGTIWENVGAFSFESNDIKSWEFEIDSALSNINYSTSRLEDEDNLRLSAIGRFAPESTNFSIDFLENLSQVPANRFRTEGVNNQRDSNIFAISPNYFFRLTPVTRVNFGYQYIDYEIESDSEDFLLQDNDRVERQGVISFINQVSPSSSLSLLLQSKDVEFDNEGVDLQRDFTQDDYLVRWQTETPTVSFSIGLGRFDVEDISGNNAEDNQYRLFFRRQINRNQSVDFQALRSVAQLFTINTATGAISVSQQNSAITRAQLSKGGGIQYQYSDTLITANIGYFDNELSGLFEQSSEQRNTYNLRLSYSLSRLFNSPLPRILTFNSTYTKNDFDIALSNVDQNIIQTNELEYTHFMSRNWSLSFRYEDRDAEILTTDFNISNQDSRAIMIGFTYQEEVSY